MGLASKIIYKLKILEGESSMRIGGGGGGESKVISI